jgi:ubiquinone/menaquinone biosynthesis C-methylase UbiE
MNTISDAPSTSQAFDKVYNSSFAHWVWSDVRIPTELKELIASNNPKTSLELGCGLGRFSEFMAEQGILAIGVDFSPIAIENGTKRVSTKVKKPILLVGDVTNLKILDKPFDVAFDVGCFHCLNEEGQRKYVEETYRLLKPNSILLIWALDSSPSGIKLNPDCIVKVFGQGFQLIKLKFSRRRIIGSHWYWFRRDEKQ